MSLAHNQPAITVKGVAMAPYSNIHHAAGVSEKRRVYLPITSLATDAGNNAVVKWTMTG
jgi:hypothetical protein